jgi:2-polyprenyl-3-methyl-5-hydroxy-6-metoxy-1,4-benzoquinol methylase
MAWRLMVKASADLNDQLLDTQRAFDSVAADYDGPSGNNGLIQRMRTQLWQAVDRRVPVGGRLLDIGCGTGLDAAHFAARGYQVVATDWSPQMVECTRTRIAGNGLSDWVSVRAIGAQDLQHLSGECFDGLYSDLGPLNCVPDLTAVSESCATLLKPRGVLIVSVIGRLCPWEWIYYTLRGDRARATVRQQRAAMPVSLNGQRVWTRYYTPREFYRVFERDFELTHYRGLSVFVPPPYLLRDRLAQVYRLLGGLDDRLTTLPGLRDLGDHFLMVLTRRA